MPIPSFTIDGVLPPYVGPDGPGGGAEDMTPYAVSALEVVATLGLTDRRKTIQWFDGSFVVRRLVFRWPTGAWIARARKRIRRGGNYPVLGRSFHLV